MKTQYKAYLLRLRRNTEQTHWRASLENAHTGEMIRFANEQEMVRYLLHTLAESEKQMEDDGRSGGISPADVT